MRATEQARDTTQGNAAPSTTTDSAAGADTTLQTHDPSSAGPHADDRPEPAKDDVQDRPAAVDSTVSSPDDLVVEPYGPNDPAYGPPSPRPDARDAEPADVGPAAGLGDDDEAAPAPRGPFEPLRPAGRRITAGDLAADPPEPAAPAEPEGLDFGPPSDPEAGTVGRLRDLYLTAEALSRDRLDRHFDELLDRQRKLISDYLKESPGPSPDAMTESATPFGFASADSLAGLRGDLRGAP